MTLTIHLALLVAAIVCFAIAAIPVSTRVNLTALGLLFVTLAFIF